MLENVLGMTHAVQGREPFMDRILRCVRLLAPEFDWVVSILHARDYLLPQTPCESFLTRHAESHHQQRASMPACFGNQAHPGGLGKVALHATLGLDAPAAEESHGLRE